MDAELGVGNQDEVRLIPKVNDLSTLPTAGKHLIIVADVNHALHLRMFDVEGKMVLDSDAKRFTSTWVEYLQQLVPKWWPPHKLTVIERISVINAVRNLAGCTYWDELREFTAGSPRLLANCGRRIPTIRAWPITCPSVGPRSSGP